RLVEVTEPQSYVYDSASNTAATAARRTVDQYDSFGELVRQSVLNGVDALGNAVSWSDTYTYFDQRGKQVAKIDAEGYLSEWQYDAGGNTVRQTEYARRAVPGWTTAGYVKPQAGDADSGYDRTTAYAYDQDDRKISETHVGVHYSALSTTLANAVESRSGD